MRRLAILCGGPSSEHAISLVSSVNVIAAARSAGFDVVVVGIAPDGRWLHFAGEAHAVDADDPARIRLADGGEPVALVATEDGGALHRLDGSGAISIDVAFPVLHGRGGEDGGVQGALALAGVPCVGCGIAASAVCMDKDLTKIVLERAGIPVVPWHTVRRGDDREEAARAAARFGTPLFVKPANAGSSVGITKVTDEAALGDALDAAFVHDDKVLIEPAFVGRELECAILDGTPPEASGIGEIVAPDGFYSYDAKYLDDSAALIPEADIDAALAEHIRETALAAFRALDCAGLARVDFFAGPSGEIVINEINTLPGFTAISMYPKLWAHRGVETPALVTRLVENALARATA